MIKQAYFSTFHIVNPAGNGLAGERHYITRRWRIALKADYLVCIYPNNPSLFHTSLNSIITKAKSYYLTDK